MLRREASAGNFSASAPLHRLQSDVGEVSSASRHVLSSGIRPLRPAELDEPKRREDILVRSSHRRLRRFADGVEMSINRARKVPVGRSADIAYPASSISGYLGFDLTPGLRYLTLADVDTSSDTNSATH